MNNEKEIKEHLKSLDKDTLIDLYLQKCYEKDFEIDEMTKSFETAESETAKLSWELSKLSEQLEEKEKEIADYKNQIQEWFGTKMAKLIDNKQKEMRKQACDEIRDLASDYWYFVLEENKKNFDDNRYVLAMKDFDEILDKIEKGENDDK